MNNTIENKNNFILLLAIGLILTVESCKCDLQEDTEDPKKICGKAGK